jgi:hypothetical protein
MAKDAKYYFNTTTGEVEVGRPSSWVARMGPYSTREEAQHALERARARNEEWASEQEPPAAGDAS